MQSEDEEPTTSAINGNSNAVVLNEECEDLEECDIQETVEMVRLMAQAKVIKKRRNFVPFSNTEP